jgi:hypothetical protein
MPSRASVRLEPTLANGKCSLAADNPAVRVGSPALGALKFASWLVEDVPMNLICGMIGREPSTC